MTMTKIPRKLIPALLAGSLAFVAKPALAIVPITFDVENGTYTFSATDGNTELNGSTVTFLNDSIVNWNLVDNTALSQGYPASYDPFIAPLTPGNSSVFDLTTYDNGTGPNAFSFEVASPTGATTTSGSIFYFEGQNNLNDFSALYDGFGGGSPTIGPVLPSFELTDPIGIWSLDVPTVPDASSSMNLLGVSFVGIAGGASLLRRRFAQK